MLTYTTGKGKKIWQLLCWQEIKKKALSHVLLVGLCYNINGKQFDGIHPNLKPVRQKSHGKSSQSVNNLSNKISKTELDYNVI